jgi:hypothetical protein
LSIHFFPFAETASFLSFELMSWLFSYEWTKPASSSKPPPASCITINHRELPSWHFVL